MHSVHIGRAIKVPEVTPKTWAVALLEPQVAQTAPGGPPSLLDYTLHRFDIKP